MSARTTFEVGSDPNGYGGPEEVTAEQARAYAEALAGGLADAFPDLDVVLVATTTFSLEPAKLRAQAWVQRNWRRVRAEVNAARGWAEQEGGRDQPGAERCS